MKRSCLSGRYSPVDPAPNPNAKGPVPPQVAEPTLEQLLSNMQSQLDYVRAQLTESQRLAAIGTIAAVIAHEFNNLLTPMISYSQYALKSAEGEKPDMELICKALSKSFASADKAGRICASMLSLARGESTVAEFPVQKLVEEALSVMARDPAKDGIALRVQIQPDLRVVGDCIQLEQVLLNLLINARQAMIDKGGALTIKAAALDESTIRIQVIDSGAGIPPKVLPRIFEPFFTTKSAARKDQIRGTGLGLAICKEIIEHHRGRIEVQSEVGRGTTFSVILPGRIAPPPSTAAPQPAPASSPTVAQNP